MLQQWQIRQGETIHGPFSDSQLLKLIESGRIKSGTPVRRGETAIWTTAQEAAWELANSGSTSPPSDICTGEPQSPSEMQSSSPDELKPIPKATPERRCPFCAETILAEAIKCKHCGEFLDGRNKSQSGTTVGTAASATSADPESRKQSGNGWLVAGSLTTLALLAAIVAGHEMWANAKWESDLVGQIAGAKFKRHLDKKSYEIEQQVWFEQLSEGYRSTEPEKPVSESDEEIERRLRQQRNPYSWLR